MKKQYNKEISEIEKKIYKSEQSYNGLDEKEQETTLVIRNNRITYEEEKYALEQSKSEGMVLTGLLRAQKKGELSGKKYFFINFFFIFFYFIIFSLFLLFFYYFYYFFF